MKKDSNSKVSWMLSQAAHSAAQTDPRMKKYFEGVRKRKPYPVAISHVANKMITVIWHMLAKDEPYEGRDEALWARKIRHVDR